MAGRLKKYLVGMLLINAILLFASSFWTEGWRDECLAQWGFAAALVKAAAVLALLNMISAVLFFIRFKVWNSISPEKIGMSHLFVSGGIAVIAVSPMVAGALNCSAGMVSKGVFYLYAQLLINELAFLICFIAFLIAMIAVAKKRGSLS
ncbi:hypothetical protein [Chromobacterium violaceum]|uniref:hypothetical protein n=1 Tax=Chromobacterium violaceum TaxID=536 RepID=UPI001BE63D50|nr:hypothetical protein [Chromobacterium violaceum]MBT2869532.1 hypothetical protein [Chromobacterium violaceum]